MDHYEIVIKGHMGPHWESWFEGMRVDRLVSGETVIQGPVKDQTSLHGMLSRIRDMGMPLIRVNTIGAGETK
jgi:hypothetical protein